MLRVRTSYVAVLLAGILAATPLFLSLPAAQAQDLSARELAEERALEAELERILAEIQEQKSYLESQRSKSASIERDIAILEAEIREAELKLEANQLRIQELTGNISATAETLEVLEANIDNQKTSLGELIRDMRELGDYSIVEMLLANDNLSDFFRRSDALLAVRSQVSSKLAEIQESQRLALEKKASLETLKDQEMDVRYAINTEKEKVEVTQNQHAELLAVSKNKEKTYEELVREREAQAAAIRSALFALRDSNTNINFGQALDLAREVETRTGVRPAFLLAILTQETNIGKNVGTCNLPSTPNRMWDSIMKPDRDIEPYLRITEGLGISPEARPLSCPQSIGWGGAMGPSQFIPSTWEMYANRVASAVGVAVADPWRPRDAFFASGLFLSDLGAGAGTYSAEYEAAGRYYAGGNWQTAGAAYANSVLNIAERIQRTQIDPLEDF